MATLCRMAWAGAARRMLEPTVSSVPVRSQKWMADPYEHATGLEKREIDAIRSGDLDPFGMNMYKRGVGTKEQPNLIPSAFESRIVGCVCHEDAASVKWMWLHKDQPRRCYCGHWFKLIEKRSIV